MLGYMLQDVISRFSRSQSPWITDLLMPVSNHQLACFPTTGLPLAKTRLSRLMKLARKDGRRAYLSKDCAHLLQNCCFGWLCLALGYKEAEALRPISCVHSRNAL